MSAKGHALSPYFSYRVAYNSLFARGFQAGGYAESGVGLKGVLIVCYRI